MLTLPLPSFVSLDASSCIEDYGAKFVHRRASRGCGSARTQARAVRSRSPVRSLVRSLCPRVFTLITASGRSTGWLKPVMYSKNQTNAD